MARKMYEEANIATIAQKIRDKAETDKTYTTAEMPNGVDEVYEKGYEKGKSEGGSNKLASLVDRSITEITAEDLKDVSVIGLWAFSNCTKVTTLDIPANVQKIERAGFGHLTGLKRFNVETLDVLFNSTFLSFEDMPSNYSHNLYVNNEPLVNLIVPPLSNYANYVNNNLKFAFRYVETLESVEFPQDLKALSSTCYGCTNLTTLKFNSTSPPTIDIYSFYQSPINKIIVPIGSLEAYKSATNFSKFADYMEEAAE